MNTDDPPDEEPLDNPAVKRHLSAELQTLLCHASFKRSRAELLPIACAIVDAFASAGILEYCYIPEGDDDTGMAWIRTDTAQVDTERDAIVIIGGEVIALMGDPIVLAIDD